MEWCGNDNDCAADGSLKRRSINRTVKWNRAVFVRPEQKITTSSSVTESLLLTSSWSQSEEFTVVTSSLKLETLSQHRVTVHSYRK